MIRDSFWTDSYVETLSPDYKLIFVYLLTNPLCNIAGIYELRAKRIAFETGYDVEVVQNILEKFKTDGKILLYNDWIILINSPKHQNIRNEKIEKGIKRIFEEDLPRNLKEFMLNNESYMSHCTLLYSTLLNLTLPNSTKPKVSDNKPSSSSDDGFDKFWSSFPRKIGKAAALKSWQKLKPPLDEVLTSIENQKQSDQWVKDNGQFIPHPTTWLNQKRWEDECEVITRNYKEVFNLFEKVLGKTIPASWWSDIQQQTHADNLYTVRGLEKVRNALEFYKENQDKEYCPIIDSPTDLDRKYEKLSRFKSSS